MSSLVSMSMYKGTSTWVSMYVSLYMCTCATVRTHKCVCARACGGACLQRALVALLVPGGGQGSWCGVGEADFRIHRACGGVQDG